MLILARRWGQEIYIGEGADRIVVKLLGPKRDRTTGKTMGCKVMIIGIDAPEHVLVLRAEIADRKRP